MTLSTRCLITPSASHTAGLHKPLASADTHARLFASNDAFSPRARLNCGSSRNAFQRKVWRAADAPHICSTVTAGAASRGRPFFLYLLRKPAALRVELWRVGARVRTPALGLQTLLRGCLCPAQHRNTSVNLCC